MELRFPAAAGLDALVSILGLSWMVERNTETLGSHVGRQRDIKEYYALDKVCESKGGSCKDSNGTMREVSTTL